MDFQTLPARATLLLLALPILTAPIARAAGATEMQDSIRHYMADHRTLSRAYDIPWSQTSFERMEELYKEWRQRLPQLDFDALNQHGRIDYILLRNELGSEMDRLTLQRERLVEMDELLSFRGTIQELERARTQNPANDERTRAVNIRNDPSISDIDWDLD